MQVNPRKYITLLFVFAVIGTTGSIAAKERFSNSKLLAEYTAQPSSLRQPLLVAQSEKAEDEQDPLDKCLEACSEAADECNEACGPEPGECTIKCGKAAKKCARKCRKKH